MTMRELPSRRQALREAACGFGAMALGSMIALERGTAATTGTPGSYDLRPKTPQLPAKAKNVIFIYVGGGPSTIDMFDPKPVLVNYHGKPAPRSEERRVGKECRS